MPNAMDSNGPIYTADQFEARRRAKKSQNPRLGDLQLGLRQAAAQWPTPSANQYECEEGKTGAERLWITPRVENRKGSAKRLKEGSNESVESQAESWATPASRDWRDGRASEETYNENSRPLNDQADRWKTPHRMSGIDHSGKRGAGGEFAAEVERWTCSPPDQTPPSGPTCWCGTHGCALPCHRRKLNPLFVEWLMGWPLGWTDADHAFAPGEMELYRSALRSRFESLR
jgi:hypothetical protein